ncbi:MAG: hypothetical protein JW822_01795 [Spirochaetales bacterium]|nr:hypothetical protein [Spirochaetales bacterium]
MLAIIFIIFAKAMSVYCIMAVAGFFILSFLDEYNGCFYIIYASLVLIFLILLLFIVYLQHPKKEKYLKEQDSTQQFILTTLRFILLPLSACFICFSIIAFIINGNSYFLLNMGCYIAFIMIIVLSEVVYKILFPLAGIDNSK